MKNFTCPNCKAAASLKDIIPNKKLREIINWFKEITWDNSITLQNNMLSISNNPNSNLINNTLVNNMKNFNSKFTYITREIEKENQNNLLYDENINNLDNDNLNAYNDINNNIDNASSNNNNNDININRENKENLANENSINFIPNRNDKDINEDIKKVENISKNNIIPNNNNSNAIENINTNINMNINTNKLISLSPNNYNNINTKIDDFNYKSNNANLQIGNKQLNTISPELNNRSVINTINNKGNTTPKLINSKISYSILDNNSESKSIKSNNITSHHEIDKIELNKNNMTTEEKMQLFNKINNNDSNTISQRKQSEDINESNSQKGIGAISKIK
jgi:hypothetical protein